MRLFLALSLPDPLADALGALQETLPGGRPTPLENLHLTLCFLGEVDDETAGDLDDMLAGIAAPAPVIDVHEIGPLPAGPRGLIAALVRADPALIALQGRVERLARACGIHLPRRRFRPHVTLARDVPVTQRLLTWLSGQPKISPQVAQRMVLVHSILRPDAAVHDPVASYPLAP